jgi:hypothetical protein
MVIRGSSYSWCWIEQFRKLLPTTSGVGQRRLPIERTSSLPATDSHPLKPKAASRDQAMTWELTTQALYGYATFSVSRLP